jgi:plastocyanin
MRKCVLLAVLVAGLGLLAATPPDAQAWGYGYYRMGYYCPPPVYYMPASYCAPPMYARPARRVVEVGAYDGRGFEPKTVNIAPGTTVRWTNHGKERHTVTSRDGKFDAELAPGETFSATFIRAGATYRYYCKPHEKMGMVGEVVVGAAGANGANGAVKNTHEGTFVRAQGETGFVMADNGKEHSHTLAAGAQLVGPDGKEWTLGDFTKGQRIRVTTKEGDMKTATKVEALPPKKE